MWNFQFHVLVFFSCIFLLFVCYGKEGLFLPPSFLQDSNPLGSLFKGIGW